MLEASLQASRVGARGVNRAPSELMHGQDHPGREHLISVPYPSGCVELNLHNVIDPKVVTLQHDWNCHRGHNWHRGGSSGLSGKVGMV